MGPTEWRHSKEGEEEFLAMLGEAEVLYDFPAVTWSTSSGSPRSSVGYRRAWPGPGR
jgi:hypothetical protein